MTPYLSDTDFALYIGDVRDVLAELADESVHCVVTSPPYWGLRDYGTGLWEGGNPDCDHSASKPSRKANAVATSGLQGGKKTVHESLVYSEVCGRCGARRIDQQLGLEPTPDLYVENMVAVFREVRRVLRRDGTLWLNIGDSYSSPGGNAGVGAGPPSATFHGEARSTSLARKQKSQGCVPGLKPKDLVGMPWRLAFALQQPYYTGGIRDERDRVWLAAMVEAEGCMFLHKRKTGQPNGQGYERKNDSYGAGLEVASTDRAIVERCLTIAGKGSICEQSSGRRQTIYRWSLRSNECRTIIRELYPHMVAKHHEARLLLGCPSSGEKAHAAHESLKALHNGEPATIDFAPPESLFEPGWYLRSEIVWSKANPMPESVTDRPTKSHEQVFLLTRSPRYFYDADAVREPNSEWTEKALAANWERRTDAKTASERNDGKSLNGEGLSRKYGLNPAGRNLRSVWEIPTEPFPQAHFATYPQALVERCVKAGTSERGCCPVCGAPWQRITESEQVDLQRTIGERQRNRGGRTDGFTKPPNGIRSNTTTLGWKPSCGCDIANPEDFRRLAPVPCTVFDPFIGSGTTALVARRLGRKCVGIELSAEYARIAAHRTQQLALEFA